MYSHAKIVLKAGHQAGARVALCLASVLLIAGCGVTEFFNKDKHDSTTLGSPSSSAPINEDAIKEQPFFVGVDGLALYTKPSVASPLIKRLSLHQKVLRSKLEKGYAYIRLPDTGEEGWVVNAKLIWKLPAKAEPVKKKAPTITDQPIRSNDQKPTVLDQEADSQPNLPAEDSAPVSKPAQQPKEKAIEPEPGTVSPTIFNSF